MCFLQFSNLVRFNGDVAAAEELAVDVELRECGPPGVLLEPLLERLIGEHVEHLEGHLAAKDLQHGVGEATLQEADRTR